MSDAMMQEEEEEDGKVRFFFHGIHYREYQVPATTTIKQVKMMIQPDALVSNAKLETQILRLQLSEESKEMTLMNDEDRTLESYGLLNNGLAREVSIKYCGEGPFVYLKFCKQPHSATNPRVRVKFFPEKDTVGSFRKRTIKEMKKQTNLKIPVEANYIGLQGRGTGRKHVSMTNYNPRASFARTLLNDVFGRWTRPYKAKLIFFPIYDPKLSEEQVSKIFDRMSV